MWVGKRGREEGRKRKEGIEKENRRKEEIGSQRLTYKLYLLLTIHSYSTIPFNIAIYLNLFS